MRYLKITVLSLLVVSCVGGGPSDTVPTQEPEVEKTEQFDYARAREIILGSRYLPIEYPNSVVPYLTSEYVEIAPRGVDQLTIEVDGEVSKPLIFWPTYPNGKLMIYHGGHGQPIDSAETLKNVTRFINEGYTVIAFAMPEGDHYRFENYTHPLRPFIYPVVVSLNYMMGQGVWDTVAMSGLSGGGWTTTLVAAIDHRITHSYPVAGSVPIFVRTDPRDKGDFEQFWEGLYSEFGYRDLYVMAASDGRRQIQILNSNDSCCFKGHLSEFYKEEVSVRAMKRLGYWNVIVVEENGHQVNEEALDIIVNDASNL